MHGDYCGWHSVNARFYMLILKLQAKIIPDKPSTIYMMKQRKYSKCPSELCPRPRPSHQPQKATLYTLLPISGSSPSTQQVPKGLQHKPEVCMAAPWGSATHLQVP